MADFASHRTATLKVYYYMPDHPSWIQWYLWQYEDIAPKFPETQRFLRHWYENIDAVIQEIFLAHVNRYGHQEIVKVDWQDVMQ